jgi:para-nitrobenzyl esterase
MPGDIATTGLGQLKGLRIGDVLQFRNVPFAQPPLGILRFAAPQPPLPWMGIREAGAHGPVPPQRPSRLRNVVGDFERPQGEDCLTLTISTPGLGAGERRPVAVFFHGGAYQAHAGSLDWYDGSELAGRGDLVVVSANYRLGVLGFLGRERGGDGRHALLDMIAALKWVSEHIDSFGGDPGRVTAMGQSAGGHAITCMLAMPEGEGLFSRAVIQSGVGGVPPFSAGHASDVHRAFVDALGIDPVAAGAEQLLDASEALARSRSKPGDIRPLFMPAVDGLSDQTRFLPAAAKGAVERKVDVLIGTTRDEAHAFFCAPGARRPDRASISAATGHLSSQEAVENAGNERLLLSSQVTDRLFRRPAADFADAILGQGGRVHTYRLDWAPDNSPLGACHCLELPLVFGNIEAWRTAPMLAGSDWKAVTALSAAVQSVWINFIRGERFAPRSIPWPGDEPARTAMEFAEEASHGTSSEPANR